MFGFLRRESPALQLYGKLPLAKDYLRLGFGDGAGLALRDWLDATFSGNAAGQTAPALPGSLRFLIGDAWGGCLQGLMYPSSDAGGLRPFPFVLAVERARRAMVADMARSLAACAAAWNELDTRFRQSAALADGRSLLNACRGVELAIADLPVVPPTAVALEPWLSALWPESGRKGLEADLERLANVRAAEDPLRLPLAAGCSQRQQVLAWLEILARLGKIDPQGCPTIFFPGATASEEGELDDDAAPRFLTVFRAAARKADGNWLGTATSDPLGPGDLAAGKPIAWLAGEPAAEGTPPLSTSLRLAVTNYLRRRGPTE